MFPTFYLSQYLKSMKNLLKPYVKPAMKAVKLESESSILAASGPSDKTIHLRMYEDGLPDDITAQSRRTDLWEEEE